MTSASSGWSYRSQEPPVPFLWDAGRCGPCTCMASEWMPLWWKVPKINRKACLLSGIKIRNRKVSSVMQFLLLLPGCYNYRLGQRMGTWIMEVTSISTYSIHHWWKAKCNPQNNPGERERQGSAGSSGPWFANAREDVRASVLEGATFFELEHLFIMWPLCGADSLHNWHVDISQAGIWFQIYALPVRRPSIPPTLSRNQAQTHHSQQTGFPFITCTLYPSSMVMRLHYIIDLRFVEKGCESDFYCVPINTEYSEEE